MNSDRNRFVVKNRRTSITFLHVVGILVIGIVGGVSMFGCTGSEKSNFYMLDSLVRFSPTPENNGTADISLGIGPITIPEYLNRPQIVTRSSRYVIDIAEFDRWAETLDASIPRVLGENLSALLATDRIYFYPWIHKTPTYQLEVEIIQFDGKIPGNVAFSARWTLLKDGSETRIYRKMFSDEKPIAGQGYQGLVSAMSLILYDLSRDIADGLLIENSSGNAAGSR